MDMEEELVNKLRGKNKNNYEKTSI